jgi:predicted nucleotidyltransferase
VLTREYIFSKIKQQKPQVEKYGVGEIGVFGSYVRDEQNQQSDIDILIDFKNGEATFDNFMDVYDLLEGMFPQEKVSVVTKNSLNKYIAPYILKEVKYV